MGDSPCLVNLCIQAVKRELLRGETTLSASEICELPSDLSDNLLTQLPPLALNNLQQQLLLKSCGYNASVDSFCGNGRKRGRNEDFNELWRTLFMSRWPDPVKLIESTEWLEEQYVKRPDLMSDWQQKYWEAHIQDCLDEAAEIAMLPSFDGDIGDITVSDSTRASVGSEGDMNSLCCDYSKLFYQFQQFGSYARSLRLQNVLCTEKTTVLLKNSNLEDLVLWRIKSKEHVYGLCKLLNQNSETLRFVEFIQCKLSSTSVNAICCSLHAKDLQTHRIENFSVKASTFLDANQSSLPDGLASFLSVGRSLCSLTLCDIQPGRHLAALLVSAVIDTSSGSSILGFSDNRTSGWLSALNQRSSNCIVSSVNARKSLKSLRVLNFRGNNLSKFDAECLKCALIHMPSLESLDISDNPIEDDGIRSLIPYIAEASNSFSPFSSLKLENCELSHHGVTQLLEILSTLKKPLHSLSIADNELGSQIAAPLAKVLSTSMRVLNAELIGLGSSGLLELEHGIGEDLKLSHINISKNRGGIATAKLLSKLISQAPELLVIKAAHNFLPAESLTSICSALKISKGKLKHLDLSGNPCCCYPAYASMVAEFQYNGVPILNLSSSPAIDKPYDDDP